jgi:hypothetical protein
VPRLAGAHTAGLSTADFVAWPDGRVGARVTFASAEPFGALGVDLDRDRDGVVTAEELAAAQGNLGRVLLDGVEVRADGAPCPASFDGATVEEADGLVLRATYGCPAGPEELAVTLYFLTALPRGHREIARVSAGGATTQAVLSGEDRAVALRLPHPAAGKRRRVSVPLTVGAALAALGLVVGLVRRARRRATS